MKKLSIVLLSMLAFNSAWAQHEDTKEKGKNALSMSLNGGLKVDKDDKSKSIEWRFANVDVGVNFLRDNSSYNSVEAQAFLQVPAGYRNENLFSLAQGNSWNVNIWPVGLHAPIVKNNKFRLGVKTSAGIQMFNFKYKKPVTFLNDTHPIVTLNDSLNINKNKLSVIYASIPVMLTFENKIGKEWLQYGVGVIGGLNIATWTKQRSKELGIQKDHDMYNLQRLQASLVAEIGIKDYFSLFVTYQVTNMFKNGIEQYPVSVGLRF